MQFGLSIARLHQFGNEPADYAAVAAGAETLGFESVWLGDHLVFPETMPATYPYSASGRGPHEPALPWLDPFITLSYLAAATQRVRLGTNVYILPLRNPFVTAKSVATLDLLSRGRVLVGIGVGWLEPEFRAVGANFHARGSLCDETLEILRALWTQDIVEFHGRHYSFDPVKFEPKPIQKPCPPIHCGGISSGALWRAATHCDGFIDPGQSFDGLALSIGRLNDFRRRVGRDNHPFEISAVSLTPPTLDDIHRYEALGVDRIISKLWPQGADGSMRVRDALETMYEFADTTLARS